MSTHTKTDDLISVPEPVVESSALRERGHRIRQALRLASGPLPNVDTETLREYYRYLAAHFSFPFQAGYHEEFGFFAERTRTVTVLRVLDPSRNIPDDFGGIYCHVRMDEHCHIRMDEHSCEVPLARLEAQQDSANDQLLDDYWYWFWNWQ
jgi:hypothetical protein